MRRLRRSRSASSRSPSASKPGTESRSVRAFTAAVTALLAAVAAAAAEPGLRNIRSSSGRFNVVGKDSTEVLPIARWLEDVARKVSDIAGRKIEADRRWTYSVLVRGESETLTGRAAMSQGFSGGYFIQKLLIDGAAAADWEAAIEAHCTLLLGAMAVEERWRSGSENWAHPVPVPAWLGAGLAQYMDTGLRARNRRLLGRWRQEGDMPRFDALLMWVYLPPGRCREKVFAGEAVGWLASGSGAKQRWERIVARLAASEGFTAAWVAEVFAYESPEALEAGWEKWLEKETRVIADPGALSSELVVRLRRTATARPGECEVPMGEGGGPGGIPLGDLVARRAEKWVPAFCAAKMGELRRLAVGRPPEFSRVTEAYCRYLEELPGHDGTPEALVGTLKEAEKLLGLLAETVLARERYVDEVLARTGAIPDNRAAIDHGALDRSVLQRYIDSFDDTNAPSRSVSSP